MKKGNRKSRAVKSVKNLPAKALTAETGRGVKGGLNYTEIKWEHYQQERDGGTQK